MTPDPTCEHCGQPRNPRNKRFCTQQCTRAWRETQAETTRALEPKHHTYSGYAAGCRDTCCRTAAATYQRQRTNDRILGNPRMIPAIGTKRRIEALNWLGWDRYYIAQRLGLYPDQVRQYTLQKWVYRNTAKAVADLYDELSMRVPEATDRMRRRMLTRGRNQARAKGYLPPLAWSDHTIDDPDAQPYVEPAQPKLPAAQASIRAKHARSQAFFEDAEFLADMGYNLTEVARRTGKNREAIQKLCGNWGRHDLYQRLASREGFDGNQYTRRAS